MAVLSLLLRSFWLPLHLVLEHRCGDLHGHAVAATCERGEDGFASAASDCARHHRHGHSHSHDHGGHGHGHGGHGHGHGGHSHGDHDHTVLADAEDPVSNRAPGAQRWGVFAARTTAPVAAPAASERASRAHAGRAAPPPEWRPPAAPARGPPALA